MASGADASDMAQMPHLFKQAHLLCLLFRLKEWSYMEVVQPEGSVAKDTVKPHEFRVPFRDVDINGEMFRAVYVSRAEEAVTEFWARRKAHKDDPFFSVCKVTCMFHSPLKLGELVRTEVGVSKIGGKTAGFLVRMTRGSEAVAEAEVLWAACDRENREPIALPEELRDWLYQFLD
jgi:acyl-CoA thioester hydrolase